MRTYSKEIAELSEADSEEEPEICQCGGAIARGVIVCGECGRGSASFYMQEEARAEEARVAEEAAEEARVAEEASEALTPSQARVAQAKAAEAAKAKEVAQAKLALEAKVSEVVAQAKAREEAKAKEEVAKANEREEVWRNVWKGEREEARLAKAREDAKASLAKAKEEVAQEKAAEELRILRIEAASVEEARVAEVYYKARLPWDCRHCLEEEGMIASFGSEDALRHHIKSRHTLAASRHRLAESSTFSSEPARVEALPPNV